MSTLTELLADARRRAMLSGIPLTPQETQGISDASAAGAPERVMMAQRLEEEKKRIAREKKLAEQMNKTDTTKAVMDTGSNALLLDNMTGSHLTGYAKTGLVNSAGKVAPNLFGMNTTNQAVNNSQGLTSLGGQAGGMIAPSVNAIPGVAPMMTTAPTSLAAQSTMMGQVAAPTMTTGTTATGATTGSTTGSTVGGSIGSIATPVAIVAAADLARNMFGGDLSKPYKDATFTQKMTRAPGNIAALPGFGTVESAVAEKAFGANNPITKVNNFMGKMEEKVVGKPLDKIFGGIGKAVGGAVKKVFCFVAGTKFVMEDGSSKNVEDIKVGDQMLEGGRVFGVGQVENDDLWEYKGCVVNAEHAVLEHTRHGAKWVRIKDSVYGKPLDRLTEVVYPVCNEGHVMIDVGGTVFSDFTETDHGTNVNDAFRLEYLNSQTEWNEQLSEKYGC